MTNYVSGNQQKPAKVGVDLAKTTNMAAILTQINAGMPQVGADKSSTRHGGAEGHAGK